MSGRLPVLNAQLAFALQAQRTNHRETVALKFSTPPQRWSSGDVYQVVQSVVLVNPALSYQIRFSRGYPYQEWHLSECDFAELRAESGEAVERCTADAIAEFKRTLDGPPISVRLIRAPDADYLIMIFDHALVDELSLALIKGQLASPRHANGCERGRYEAAINDMKGSEEVAQNGPGIAFWGDRFRAVQGNFPQIRSGSGKPAPMTALPSVTIPPGLRGSLFPYVLFSLHRALRDVADEPASTVIGYPWGGRNAKFSDVVGCFMNTAVSMDTTGSRRGPEAVVDFRDGWLQELDHADVPFTALTGLGTGFTGAVTAYLNYTHARERTVNIAGVEAVIPPPATHAEIPVTASFLAAATVAGDEVRLRLFIEEHLLGSEPGQLGARWCHWLGVAMSRSSERLGSGTDHRTSTMRRSRPTSSR